MAIGRLLVVTMLLALPPLDTFAGNLKDAPVIFKSGNWSVRQSTDLMNDKKTCVALYKDGFYIQVTEANFSVSETYPVSLYGRGGIQGYTYRVDDAPPTKMKVATDIEKKVSAAYLTGSEFRQLLSSRRFRIQVLTMLPSLVEEDIDLRGLSEIHGVLTGMKCR